MNITTPFDYIDYIRHLTESNKLAREAGFTFTTCSGIAHLEGLLQELQQATHIVATTDTCEESLLQVGGSWVKRRLFTTFILARYTYGDGASYQAALATCRELYRQFLARHLHDEQLRQPAMLYLHLDDVRTQELGGTFLAGATGLYFMLAMDEPTDLTYQDEQWEEEAEAQAQPNP